MALLHKHIHECEVKTETIEIAALKLNEQLEAARQMLSVSASFTASSTTGMSDMLLYILQRKAAKKVKDYEKKLIWLQLSIAGLQGQIAKAQELTTYQHFRIGTKTYCKIVYTVRWLGW